MSVAIITCSVHPALTECDLYFANYLKQKGLQYDALIWDQTDSKKLSNYDAIVIRSPWDYIKKLDQFEEWLKSLPDQNVYNSKRILLWNLDKIYLKDLFEANIKTVPTKWISAKTSILEIENEIMSSEWSELVIKPSRNAGGHFTYKFTKATIPDLNLLKNRTLMLQPFLPEIVSRGEVSLIYAGDNFSHAIIKTAKKGEFRIQVDYGGKEQLYAPTPEELAFGDKVNKFLINKFCLDEILYVRIDIANYKNEPHLIELEILEPSLFFNHAPEKAELFANELIRRIRI